MNIFKFGGASVKDAAGVINVCRILTHYASQDLGVVVSAMGKTTNALELILAHYQKEDPAYNQLIIDLENSHHRIVSDLEEHLSTSGDALLSRFRESGITNDIKQLIKDLKEDLTRNKSRNYSFIYDQIVGYGELLSTKIVVAYLNTCGASVTWLDARQLIKTDSKYRDAAVNWSQSETAITAACSNRFFLTQGFIGSDDNGFTTTLGRAGSDYTAGILAYCLDAGSVTIWKDVPGVLNADPRAFEQTQLIHSMPYNEAIELAFYGASVIHPKTLQPLQGKKIALKVRSFVDFEAPGTVIKEQDLMDPEVPCYIVRNQLVFLKISARDFSFIGEGNISDIFHELNRFKIQVGLIQNSAISFSLCVEDKYGKIQELLHALSQKYKVSHVENISLYTVRHYDDSSTAIIEKGREVILKQFTQDTLQLVVKN
jgi:aspartate kinase